MMKWFRFTFADGYWFEARGLTKQELRVEEIKHGKLVAKTRV